jgi:putative acetyltransferase
MQIKVDDVTSKQVLGLLEEHHKDMLLHSPPESVHALDVTSLQASDVTFWSAWIDDKLAGCGALKQLTTSHAEIKSMRTSLLFRRKGVAAQILQFILNYAEDYGYSQVSLETGSMDAFIPARKMYEKFGFHYCSTFADYIKDENSVYMNKKFSREHIANSVRIKH